MERTPASVIDEPRADARRGPIIRLDHAAIMTTRLEEAIAFYTDLLGLNLRIIEDDPIRKGCRRAMLTDADEADVVEIIEMTEMAHPFIPGRGAIHHLGFRLPQADWHSLRSRLDARAYPYQEIQGRLFVRDADGLVLEIEQLRHTHLTGGNGHA